MQRNCSNTATTYRRPTGVRRLRLLLLRWTRIYMCVPPYRSDGKDTAMKSNDSKKRKSGFNPNRTCYLTADGNSPTLDEAPLQQAILAALNKAMADKNSLIRQITDAMETEIIPFPGGTMSLGDIERRLRELEQQFQTLLEKAADDPAAYGGQFKEILDEQTLLKERRSGILADNNEQAKANQRIMDAAQTLENASLHITEWDESAVRQLVETVKVLSKDEIAVTLKGGIEIRQKIMY